MTFAHTRNVCVEPPFDNSSFGFELNVNVESYVFACGSSFGFDTRYHGIRFYAFIFVVDAPRHKERSENYEKQQKLRFETVGKVEEILQEHINSSWDELVNLGIIEIVNKFKNARGKKIICGGTTARIVSRELKKIYKPGKIVDKDIPPVGYIEGVDLVTEGVITLQKATSILEHILNTTDYEVLYKEDGSSKLAKMLYEDSLHIKLMVGKSVNQTNQILELSNKLSNKVDILNHLKDVLIKLGKIVDIEYF